MFSCFVLLTTLNFVLTSDVLEYTHSNFYDEIASHQTVLVKFYTPWCGYCKKLAPEYEKAATILKKNDPPVPLIKVDCTAETAVCDKYSVKSYPTLKIFKNGVVESEYTGPRDADAIVKYMNLKASPISTELNSVADAEKFLSNDDQSVVGFFTQGGSILAEFQRTAEALNDRFRFAHTTNAELLAKYGYKDNVVIFQPVRLQNNFEPSTNVFEGDITYMNLVIFVHANYHGLVGHRTKANKDTFHEPIVHVYFNVDYVNNVEETNNVRNEMLKIAKKLKEEKIKIKFAISKTEEFTGTITYFDFKNINNDTKYVVGYDARYTKYKFDGEYSSENLEKFARDLAAGKLEKYVQSEPIPETNDEPVKVVVAKNFEQIVNDPTKDVLIEFYAPWCTHCKSLEVLYENVAYKLSNEKDIIVAKMDSSANDVPRPFIIEA